MAFTRPWVAFPAPQNKVQHERERPPGVTGRSHDASGAPSSHLPVRQGWWGPLQKAGRARHPHPCPFPENGNRYEGSWEQGRKHGHGRFFHLDHGQLFEGFWVEDVAKCGTMIDFGRDEAPAPTQFPIPKVGSSLRPWGHSPRGTAPGPRESQQGRQPAPLPQRIPLPATGQASRP